MDMKNIYRLIFTTAVIAASLTACSVEEPVTGAVKEPQKVSPVSDDAVAGELLCQALLCLQVLGIKIGSTFAVE